MDDFAHKQPRLGAHTLPVIADPFPASLSERATADTGHRISADARSAGPMPSAVHAPPPRPHTSILQAERQAKLLVFVAALAAGAYFFHAVF